MADKRILAFNGSTITALRWQNGLVTTDQLFTADSVGHEAFSAYLATAAGALMHLVADVGEEGFQLETIPAVQGSDREALIKRRLGQFFFGTAYTLGLSLGRQKDGRRDERMLFAALTHPETLTPWLELVQASAAPLVGIYSVPLLLAEHAKNMVSGHEQFLLVTRAVNGLRHTFFNEGKIQFSRLSQLASHTQEEFAVSCAREATRTHQYLLGQRLVARKVAMPTVVLAHAIDHPVLRAQLADTEKIHFELLDLETVAKNARLKTPLRDSNCDTLFAHLVVAFPPKTQFAPSSERKKYRLSQLRFGLRAVSFATLFLCLVIASRIGLQWKNLQDEIVVINSQTAADKQRHAALLDELPKIKLTPDNLRAVIVRYQEIMQRASGPGPLLTHLSTALEAMPQVSLQRLEWKLKEGGASNAVGANTALATSNPPPPLAAGAALATLDVVARLPLSTAADQRLQIETVDALIARLRTESIQVSMIKSTVDIESGKTLKRAAADSVRPTAAPEFTIRLTTVL